MDADPQLAHERARDHDRRQQAAGLRHAAIQLECTLPVGKIQADTVRKVIGWLRQAAIDVEAGQDVED